MSDYTDKTDNLMQKLVSCDTDSELTDYVDFIDGKYPLTLHEYLKTIIDARNMTVADLQRASKLDRNYIYQIMDGSRQPGRDKIIAIALGAGMTLEECQRALEISREGILYPKSRRDSIIIYAIKNNLSVMDLNKLLEEYKELTLQ